MERRADQIAIKALEKQIPMKPESVSYGDADGYPVWNYSCPECGYEFDHFDEFDYCPDCGQRMDWEEDKEEA